MAVFVLAALALGSVEVEGATTCPTPAQVSERLRALLPAEGRGDRARLEQTDGTLLVELRRADGTAVAWRRLETAASCDDLASAAAVMIATWETEMAAAPPPVAHLDAPPAPVLPPVTARRVAWEVGLGFAASYAGSFAPGATLDVAAARPGGRLAARMGLVFADARQEPLGMGQAQWSRLVFAAGPSYRFAPAHWLLDVHAEALGAVLSTEGVGFDTTRSDTSFEPGLGAGVRLALPPRPLLPWMGMQVQGFTMHQEMRVDGIAQTVTLPRVELLVTAGIAIGAAR